MFSNFVPDILKKQPEMAFFDSNEWTDFMKFLENGSFWKWISLPKNHQRDYQVHKD